jgi:ATP-dependent helicase/DNAse subunit B
MDKEKFKLSSSRIKTFEDCSTRYGYRYFYKIPEAKNAGALLGSIVHTVFECLTKSRRKSHFDKIIQSKWIAGSASVQRLVEKLLKRDGIYNPENLLLVNDMIMVGLQNDFFPKKGSVIGVEQEFIIENKDPEYIITGFIDKLIQYGKKFKIIDYKSQKNKFTAEELSGNLQAMVYSLFLKKQQPKAASVVNFILLRYKKKPIQEVSFTEDQLLGLEYYLSILYKRLQKFSEKDMFINPAVNNQEKSWLCRAGKTWRCPYLDPFEYFVLLNKDGKVVSSDFKKENLTIKNEGDTIQARYHNGCEAYNKNQEI